MHFSSLFLLVAVLPFAAAQVCAPGQTLVSGACAACPAGSACPGGSALFSIDGSARVSEAPSFACGAGKVPSADASACVWDGTTVCAPGTYRYPGSGNTMPLCNPCPWNAFCAGGSEMPSHWVTAA